MKSTAGPGVGGRRGRAGNCKANLLQIWHNEPQVNSSHLLGLGEAVPTCAGVFILPGPDMATNLVVVLDHKREDLRPCSDHQCPGGGGKP